MFGYIKLGAAVPKARIGGCIYNGEQIIECVKTASAQNVKLLVFPELAVSCYTCGDLFFQQALISECEKTIGLIAEKSAEYDIVSVIGAPVMANGRLFNCAVVIHGGNILGIVPKEHLSEGGGFNENRWFQNGETARGMGVTSVFYCGKNVPFGKIIFKCVNYHNFNLAVEICGDLWSVYPPSGQYCLMGATVIANPSASPAYAGITLKRAGMVKVHSEKCACVYVYSASSIGESTSDAVFDGQALIAEQGGIIAESCRFSVENEIIIKEADLESVGITRMKSGAFSSVGICGSEIQRVEFSFNNEDDIMPEAVPDKSPFAPKRDADGFYSDIFKIQTYGLYKRLTHTGIKKAVIGVSGGLDSTLALLVAANCCDKLGLPRESVAAITLPGFGTSGETHSNAVALMEGLGIPVREISIKEACLQHFKDIGHSMDKTDAAFENAQARERTQILMDVANMENGLVIGTGDMSELALGWATYNGDHMSMYGVNAGLPKTVIRELVTWLAEKNMFGSGVSSVLRNILETPISPELLPARGNGEIAQKTEDLIGPYELHDYFIYYSVHKGFSPEKIAFLAKRSFEGVYDEDEILKWLRVYFKRFFSQQFKRSCSPDAPQALEFSLSQRADLKIPSDVSGDIWNC